jgi:hypothetical protein
MFNVHPTCLKRLDLDSIPLTAIVSTLSGGEQGRFYLTLLLNQEADLYVLDEPCSGLSLPHQQRVMDWIIEKSKGSLVLVASHLQRWMNFAHLRLSLQPNGLSQFDVLHPSPPPLRRKKPHHKIKAIPLPFIAHNILFYVGRFLTWFGVWFFSLSLFVSGWMLSQDKQALDQSWIMPIERFDSISIENSPYVLTQTSIPQEKEIRMLFSSTPLRIIGKDLSPLFPSRLHVNNKIYTIVWYEQARGTPLALMQGQGPDRLESLLWDIPFRWTHEIESLEWKETFQIQISSWNERKGPWEDNYLFLSYQAWYQHLRQYTLWPSYSLIDALEQFPGSWPWIVSVPYREYHVLNDVLKAEGYRVYHAYLHIYEQRFLLIQSWQQWLVILALILIGVFIFLHGSFHVWQSKQSISLRYQMIRMGVSNSMIVRSVYRLENTFYFLVTSVISIVFFRIVSLYFNVSFSTLLWFFSWLMWAVFLGIGLLRGVEKKVIYGYPF